MVQIDADLTVYGEECTFGLGKVRFAFFTVDIIKERIF